MHSLYTILKINRPVEESPHNDITNQAKWVLSLLTNSQRTQFSLSGRFPEIYRKRLASQGINVPLLEPSALLELLK